MALIKQDGNLKLADKITLKQWFANRMSAAYGPSVGSLSPTIALQQIGAPELLLKLAALTTQTVDGEFNLKYCHDGLVPDLEGREKKQKRSTGQFYTPEHLAGQMAEMACLRAGAKILDPACGDGSFLLALAAKLNLDCKKKINSKKILKLPDSAGIAGEVGESNFKKTIKSNQNPANPNREQNICFNLETSSNYPCKSPFLNNLHGFDIDAPALFICLIRLITTFPGCGWPNLALRDFLLQPAEDSFDLVIGNPPYRVNLDSELKNRLNELYQTAEGEKDLYTFFIEGGLCSLREGGRLIMLTSHTYLVNHHCSKIRDLVFSHNQVEKILMLPERFFAMAPGVLPVVTVILHQESDQKRAVKVATDYRPEIGWQKEFSAAPESFLDGRGLRQAIVPAALAEVFRIMGNGHEKLGELCKVGVGIQESQRRGGVISRFVSDESESARHRPVLRGRELVPFGINWEGKYIDYGPHLAFAGCEKTFLHAKVLYQNIRNERLKQRLVAAFDGCGFFPKNSLSYIVPAENLYKGDFLCGLLNSRLINAWFSGNFHSFHITVTQVRQIPLPKLSEATEIACVADIAMILAQLPEDAPDRLRYMHDLDQAVCRCYLGAGDHSGLLTMCDNFLDQAACL